MALTINDVLTLGKMGFSKADIAALMGAMPSTPAQAVPAAASATVAAPAAVPQTTPAAVPAVETPAPAAPDYAALVNGLAELTAKVSALSVPSAGTVGNPAPETSIEDIILSAYQPTTDNSTLSDFSKGVNK